MEQISCLNIYEAIFPLFGGTFHLIKGICLRGMFTNTSVLALGSVLLRFRKFSTMFFRVRESFIA